MKKHIVLLLALLFSGCDAGPSVEERLAKAETLAEVVEAVTFKQPSQAYVIPSTNYLAIVFAGEQQNADDYNALKVKELMPVLLDRYPEVQRFFFGFAVDDRQYMKIQMERSAALDRVQWDMIKAADIEALSSMYWPKRR